MKRQRRKRERRRESMRDPERVQRTSTAAQEKEREVPEKIDAAVVKVSKPV